MDVIELECPHCGDALELDAAFAGGVCRCSTCGTLMTVPADPSRDRAETLTRSERPDSPGGRPGSPGGRPDVPGGPVTRPDVPGGRRDTPVAVEDSSADDLAALAGADVASPPVQALPADDVYITASGKSLKLASAVVPTARKRKKVIRATVIAIFIACTLGLFAIIIVVAMMLFGGDDKPKFIENPDIVGVDPSINPIKAEKPNLLSIEIGSEAAIIVDGTSFARQWYPQMSEIIVHAVSKSATIDYQLIPWTDLNPKAFGGTKPAKIGADKLDSLKSFFQGFSNVGNSAPAPFVQVALDERADQIFLIAGRVLEETEVTALREAIAKRVDTRFDAIVIGDHDEALQKLAQDNKGQYVSVKIDQLQKWYDEWKKPAN